MSFSSRAQPGRRSRRLAPRIYHALIAACAALLFASTCAFAHEGHDHDKPAPLNLPVAARVIAVTPEYELVGIVSGEQRMTIFLRRFETGEPVRDAALTVAVGEQQAEAVRIEDGVFEMTAPWLASAYPLDLVFHLTVPGDQDILAGTLEGRPQAGASVTASRGGLSREALIALGALTLGALLAFAYVKKTRARANHIPAQRKNVAQVGTLNKRAFGLGLGLVASVLTGSDGAAAQSGPPLPSLPATMATDAPQRMPDASLFVPAATQHLLAIRTVRSEEGKAPRTVQLVGTVTPDPNSFGRVQAGHAGQIISPQGGIPHVGKKVQKGEVLAHLQHHLEAYNRGNLQAEVAELEARIALQEAKLARYLAAPLAVPPIRIDETKGEIEALRKRRKELSPTLAQRDDIRSPIDGIVSSVTIVVGQSVDAREVLFEIVDPTRYWIEAIAHDPSVANHVQTAVAVTRNGENLELEYAGLGLSLKQQASPLTFRIKGAPGILSIGQPLTVIVQSATAVTGIVLPSSSIVKMGNGLSAVWVKKDPERFEPHTVRYEPLDGQRVVILAGLKPDLRVVTTGASLLNQIR